MGFIKEFKEFAVKGNVMDMAVGVIIGGAFGKIFVNLSDDVKYKTLAEAQEAGASVFAYGQFVQNVIDFIIIAFCIFMMLKGINKLNRKKEEPAPEPEAPAGPTQEELLAEIRDLLKNK